MKTNIFSLELDFEKFEKFLELFEDAVIISDSEGKSFWQIQKQKASFNIQFQNY
jgi:hypothetical protein